MKRVAFYTLGCKVNQYETEAMEELFEKAGYQVVDFEERADIYVINTCNVTGLSARKSRQVIRKAKAKNKDSIVAVVGCYSQTAPDEVISIPGVNLIIGTKDRTKIIEYINEIKFNTDKLNKVGNIMTAKNFEELNIERYRERTRAFIKIQEGCNQFCTYCIIPYARGPVRSKPPEKLIEEVKKLAANGFKEVVLTGIHIASYGKDIGSTSLLDIIKVIHEIEGIERIRLGSIEPTTITDDFIETARNLEKLCPHYHISLQSGCDSTLKRMNRKYNTSEYRKVVELIRENIKDAAITTDVMVGFPGETDEEFKQTYMFLEEISFAAMHIFKYSPRKGTPAAKFPNQVSPEVKEQRSNMLIELSQRKTVEFNKNYLGRIMPVLFEQEVKMQKGLIEGLTPNYIRVLCKGNNDQKGKILNTRIDKTEEDYVIGTIIGDV